MFDFWIQFALVLTAILIGIRRGGVALGLIGGLGVAVLSFGFRVAPQEPPITVMLIILAVVTASATLQVAGGLDWLVQQAERVMRKHPQQITILAPLSTFLLTVCVGTGHAVYSLLPVIADVALKTKIRPERPMAISSVASQMGITASPVAAAVTTFLAMTAKTDAPVTAGPSPPSSSPRHRAHPAHVRLLHLQSNLRQHRSAAHHHSRPGPTAQRAASARLAPARVMMTT